MTKSLFRPAMLGLASSLALLSLVACKSAEQSTGASATAEGNVGLRVVPLTIQQGKTTHAFQVEVAQSPEEQSKGLMFRTSLAPDRGMIFPYDPPRTASFWMKNTLIPLDMLFIRADGTIDRIAENTIPESLEPVASGGDVAAVLELPGGTAARLGIDESAIVKWQTQAGN